MLLKNIKSQVDNFNFSFSADNTEQTCCKLMTQVKTTGSLRLSQMVICFWAVVWCVLDLQEGFLINLNFHMYNIFLTKRCHYLLSIRLFLGKTYITSWIFFPQIGDMRWTFLLLVYEINNLLDPKETIRNILTSEVFIVVTCKWAEFMHSYVTYV